jgi:hypothetical protein
MKVSFGWMGQKGSQDLQQTKLNNGEEVFDGLVTRDIHTKRQVTQHGCLSSLLGDGTKEMK